MKHLIIRSFGPIDNVEINLKRVNLIIGPQSSGKSTLLKVACYCTWVEKQVMRTQEPERFCETNTFLRNLVLFHRLEGYVNEKSYIEYQTEFIKICFDAMLNKTSFEWRDARWKYKSTKITYIPAERNIVSVIPNWYDIEMDRNNIFAFMNDWEETRKNFEQKVQLMSLPFNYSFNKKTRSDQIQLENGEKISLTNASSGLQSLVPLLMTIYYLTDEVFKKDKNSVANEQAMIHLLKYVNQMEWSDDMLPKFAVAYELFFPRYTSFFIEEPEAHIYPSTQKDFVYSLVERLNDEKQHFCFIATHSPYIMTSFNNLLLAGEKAGESDVVKSKVLKRFRKQQLLNFEEVSAFAIDKGKVVDILDYDYKMIVAEKLDGVSEEIARDYDYLLSL